MTRRTTVLAAALLLAACGISNGLTPQQRADRCADFARAVARAQLSGTPDEKLAREVADSLDGKLSRLGSPDLHDPAVSLHQDLHAVQLAQRQGSSSKADEAAAKARTHAAALAKACDLPVTDFVPPQS